MHEEWLFTTPWGERERFMLAEVPQCDYFWFTGADVLLTNHQIGIEQVITDQFDGNFDMLASEDRYGFNNDSFIIKSSERAVEFLNRAIALNDTHANDQSAMWEVMNTYADFNTKIVSQRVFNSYLYGEYGEAGREGSWEFGDLALHLPGMPNERRIELLDGLAMQVVR